MIFFGFPSFITVNATTRLDADGSIVGVVGVAQDVTEQRLNELHTLNIARELRWESYEFTNLSIGEISVF